MLGGGVCDLVFCELAIFYFNLVTLSMMPLILHRIDTAHKLCPILTVDRRMEDPYIVNTSQKNGVLESILGVFSFLIG